MTHGEPLGLLEPGGLGEHRVLGPGDHHRSRPVDGGDVDISRNFARRGLYGDHRPTGRKRLHQRGPGGDERAGVVQGENPGAVRRRDLADRVTGHDVGPHPERLQQPEQRHLEREDRPAGRTAVPSRPRTGRERRPPRRCGRWTAPTEPVFPGPAHAGSSRLSADPPAPEDPASPDPAHAGSSRLPADRPTPEDRGRRSRRDHRGGDPGPGRTPRRTPGRRRRARAPCPAAATPGR